MHKQIFAGVRLKLFHSVGTSNRLFGLSPFTRIVGSYWTEASPVQNDGFFSMLWAASRGHTAIYNCQLVTLDVHFWKIVQINRTFLAAGN